jgi:homogentisate phytyltransferase / homogentisate geranylgeranyltransferase
MKALKTLWQFSRPHTIIGSICSITALYIIACNGNALQQNIGLYLYTLVAALGCNVFIVGINQIADVEMDKINKPYLPLAAGTLSRKNALTIVLLSLAIALIFAFMASLFYLGLIIIILLIGIAYSLPPLYLKQHHLPAALAITLVRGLLVNVGIFMHFQKEINGNYDLPGHIWCLAFFIMAFSIAIAWFKDLPDTEGDEKFHVQTLAVLYSKKNALTGGTILVGIAYVLVLLWSFLYAPKNSWYLIITHGSLFVFFLLNYFSVQLEDKNSVKKFYLRFWVFFFAEYIVFAVWAML